MYHLLLLCAALLTVCAGKSSVDGPPQKVRALAGEEVILPCRFQITDSSDFPTVEWSKKGSTPQIVFLYRDGCETYEMKDPAFKYRTSLIPEELKNGDISVRISNLQLYDAGIYECRTLWTKRPWDVTAVELVVDAVSEPELSIISAVSGSVTLQCEANCWLPAPEIHFLDDQGNIIPTDDTKKDRDGRDCYNMTLRVTLQDATERVTCRAHQPENNETRSKQIVIPVGYKCSCSLTLGVAVGLAVLLLISWGGLVFLLWERCCKSEGQKMPMTRQTSDESEASGTSESQPFLQRGGADETDRLRNHTDEQLTRQVADPKAKLPERDESITQLQNNSTSQLRPVISRVHQPMIVCGPSRSPPVVPDPFSPPFDQGPQLRSLPNDQNLDSVASSTPPMSGYLSQNKVLKPAISWQNSFPAPVQRNLTPSRACSFSARTGKKKHSPVSRTMSVSCAEHDPILPKVARNDRIHSCPALLDTSVVVASTSFSANAVKRKVVQVSGSTSEPHGRRGPIVPKIQRRHSSSIRFTPLEDLPESEQS